MDADIKTRLEIILAIVSKALESVFETRLRPSNINSAEVITWTYRPVAHLQEGQIVVSVPVNAVLTKKEALALIFEGWKAARLALIAAGQIDGLVRTKKNTPHGFWHMNQFCLNSYYFRLWIKGFKFGTKDLPKSA